jgi:hypothetical protein
MTPCPDRRQGIIIVPLIEIRMVGRIAMTFAEIERGAKANLRRVSILFFGPALADSEPGARRYGRRFTMTAPAVWTENASKHTS